MGKETGNVHLDGGVKIYLKKNAVPWKVNETGREQIVDNSRIKNRTRTTEKN